MRGVKERFCGQKAPGPKSGSFSRSQSDRSGNLAGAHAPGADIHVARGTIHDRLDTFHVGLPGTVGTPVRVRDLNAKGHAFAAILALSHPLHLPAVA